MNWLLSLFEALVAFLSSTSPVPQAVIATQEPLQQPQPLEVTINPPMTQTPLLERFIEELKSMEGWTPGTTSYLCKNPGNLRCGPDKAQWNVLANGAHGGFCTFKDEQTGMQALRNVTLSQCKGTSPAYNAAAYKLGLLSSANLNLFQYFKVRDPATDSNDPHALALRFGKVLGVDPQSFQLRQLL